MIQSLEYDVQFSTGKTLKGKFDFGTGVMMITGANESGKSFCLEMIRYALFGSKALRSKASDFVSLKMVADFRIGKEDITVERTLKTANTGTLSGTRPVNEFILGKLGFGIEVFDLTCAVMQNEVERFGQMPAALRKKLVDETIGMDAVKELEDHARKTALDLSKNEATLRETVSEPVAPEKPANYSDAEELQNTIVDLKILLREMEDLGPMVELSAAASIPTEIEFDENEIEDLEREFARIERIRARWDAVITEGAVYSEVDLQLVEAHLLAAKFPKPENSKEAVLEALDRWEEVEARARWEKGSITCPSCKHEFSDDQEPPKVVEPEIPKAIAQVDLMAWNTRENNGVQDNLDPNPLPHLTTEDVKAAREQAARIAALPDNEELPDDPAPLRAAFEQHRRDVREWEKTKEEREKNARRQELKAKGLEPRIEALDDIRLRSATYDTQQAIYLSSKTRWDEVQEQAAELAERSEEWTKASLAMKELRASVKQHLLPSLNRVASSLISRMTNGQRVSVEVDDAFEIMIDGQPLETLSGSGKAVANLALRIGLGQVLTGRVFSVLLADEIDGSMDDERSTATMGTLENLIGEIDQIIVVSHKDHDISNKIRMG